MRTSNNRRTIEKKKKKLGHFWHSKKSLDSVNIEIFDAFDVVMSTMRDYYPTHKPTSSFMFIRSWLELIGNRKAMMMSTCCRSSSSVMLSSFFSDDERRKFYCHIVRHSDSTLPLASSPSCCHDSLCFMILKAMNRLEQ